MRASGTAAEAVRRAQCVPLRHKVFDQNTGSATKVHRVDPALLDDMVSLGLPHRREHGTRLFDALDLENAGLLLGLPNPRSRAMRYWSRSLLRDDIGAGGYAVTLAARCPAPGHPGPCHFALNPQLTAAVQGLRATGPGEYRFDVTTPHTDTRFGPPFTALIDRLSSMRFHMLPKALYDDVGFARRTGLAGCNLASRVAVVLGGELGLPVRAVHGYFMTAPYLMWHHWCEFRHGDEWLAADPFLLTAMRRWQLPGSDRWPAHRSPGALLWRIGVQDMTIGSRRFAAVTHDGVPALFTIAQRGSDTPTGSTGR